MTAGRGRIISGRVAEPVTCVMALHIDLTRNFIDTGTDSHRLAQTRARAEQRIVG